jgi:hypothetical protein
MVFQTGKLCSSRKSVTLLANPDRKRARRWSTDGYDRSAPPITSNHFAAILPDSDDMTLQISREDSRPARKSAQRGFARGFRMS